MKLFNSQLMQDELEATLFMCGVNYSDFESHADGIEANIEGLINKAIAEREDPNLLIEGYLQISNDSGRSVEDFKTLIMKSPQMEVALTQLSQNWDAYDPALPDEGITELYGSTVSAEEASEIYLRTSLRSYLENLYANSIQHD
ncbi:MAG: hypothetical protein WBA74_01730 [Cyclobacteriaceae bacterium]